jgi:predicted alpha/beta superfamily hydrolase
MIAVLLLSSCGGSSSESNSTPSPTTTINNNLLPQTLNNTHLEITLNNPIDTSAQHDLPQITEKLTHYFGNGDVVYLQAIQENYWQYRGTFIYERLNDDTAKITVTISDSSREYSLDCVFTDANTGTCNALIEQGIEINGEFTLSANIASEDHNFVGTIEDEQSFSSSITGITYPYRVYLPEGYHQSDKSYPILYATDGQWEFWRFSYVIETSDKEIILVAIEQGPDQRRVIDYALEGSHDYLDFLETEMLPLIESTYRVDTSNRTLEGASWGGLLVRHALSRETTNPLFKNFISIDGSYGNFTQAPFISNNSQYQTMEDVAFPAGAALNANFYLSGATIAGNGHLVERFKTELQNRDIKELTIYHQSFNVRHEEAARPSIKDALIKLFP